MPKVDPTELSRAFLDTGALVVGGIGGAGLSYLIFGEQWALQATFAIGGAWLVHYLVAKNRRPGASRHE
jgi:hypothetical protein